MKLLNFKIKELYGSYSYDIPFSSVNPYLLTGPNGYGKTTILTIIDRLKTKQLIYFYQLPFLNIELSFSDNIVIVISQSSLAESSSDDLFSVNKRVCFECRTGDVSLPSFELSTQILNKAVRRVGYYHREVFPTNDYCSIEFAEFAANNGQIYEYIASEQGAKDFLMVLSNISELFIEAQRISRNKGVNRTTSLSDTNKYPSSIDYVVNGLKRKLQESKNEYLIYAQQLDSAFIERLIDSSNSIEADAYNQRVFAIKKSINEIQSYGLISGNITIPEYNLKKSTILSAYIEEIEDKLKIYEETVQKLRLFSELCEKKEFTNKSVSFSPQSGLRIKLANGTYLDNLNKLSSGEQNELILLYQLVFNVSDNSILLIDEPEISLHVIWQLQFLDEVSSIIQEKGLQVIIATHSPQIINNRWAESFDLSEHNEFN